MVKSNVRCLADTKPVANNKTPRIRENIAVSPNTYFNGGGDQTRDTGKTAENQARPETLVKTGETTVGEMGCRGPSTRFIWSILMQSL